jgi:hypothetical protein
LGSEKMTLKNAILSGLLSISNEAIGTKDSIEFCSAVHCARVLAAQWGIKEIIFAGLDNLTYRVTLSALEDANELLSRI